MITYVNFARRTSINGSYINGGLINGSSIDGISGGGIDGDGCIYVRRGDG